MNISYLWKEKKNKSDQNYLLFFSVLSILIDQVILFGLWFQSWDMQILCRIKFDITLSRFLVTWNAINKEKNLAIKTFSPC